jgi:hypothetical protein
MQALFTVSERVASTLPGHPARRVLRLPDGLKVPHMAEQRAPMRPYPVFDGIADGAYFYFVHSYYAAPEDASVVAGETTYGVTFAAVVATANIVATQFHPEKSGESGLRLYENFLRLAREGRVSGTGLPQRQPCSYILSVKAHPCPPASLLRPGVCFCSRGGLGRDGIDPAVDIRGGRCVACISDHGRDRSADDPVERPRRWQDEGARCLHVVDSTAPAKAATMLIP